MKFKFLVLAATLAIPQFLDAQSSARNSSARQQSSLSTSSQQPAPSDPFARVPAAKSADVNSIDSILSALYAVISGPPGERDWNRFRSLFINTAHLTSTSVASDGSIRVHSNPVEGYVSGAGAYFLKNGFFEKPIVNRIESFGNITQVFSSYESRHAASDAPFARGINSIQLLYDGKRWWIASIIWDEERPGNPLPRDFAANH